jgi:putative nucleotidyltransferase with HDIG domain
LFHQKQLPVKVRVAVLCASKKFDAKSLINLLAEQTRKTAQAVTEYKENDFSNIARSTVKNQEQDFLLMGLDENIDEKNLQLLTLYDKLRKEHDKSKEAFFQIITSLVNALEARDSYTQGHSQRVTNYALKIAQKLGWSNEEIEKLRKASLLHDLGKIGIPDSILHKKGQLTEEEFGFIKKHEIFGVNILLPLKELESILPWIMYHHEKWDGSGYPHGLSAESIPMGAQIIAVSDVYDALTTGRDYKLALTPADAFNILIKSKGTHFNPQLVDIFVSLFPEQTPK